MQTARGFRLDILKCALECARRGVTMVDKTAFTRLMIRGWRQTLNNCIINDLITVAMGPNGEK